MRQQGMGVAAAGKEGRQGGKPSVDSCRQLALWGDALGCIRHKREQAQLVCPRCSRAASWLYLSSVCLPSSSSLSLRSAASSSSRAARSDLQRRTHEGCFAGVRKSQLAG